MEMREPTLVQAPASSGSLDMVVYGAAAISVVAATIHLWATPEHFYEWWGYGLFFLAVALAQGLFGVMILRWPGQRFALAGILGNLSIILVYLLSRTTGIPVGPHTGAEEAGALDMAATAAEIALVVLLVSLLNGAYRKFVVNGLLVLGLAIWSLRFAGVVS